MTSQRYTSGIVLGLATAAVIAWLSLWPILDSGLGYGIIVVILLAACLALPLLLALVVVTIVHARRRPAPPGRVHAWMWLPTVAALMILPVAMLVDDVGQRAHDERHPSIFEQHVNLSGQALWIGTGGTSTRSGGPARMPMPAETPWTLSEFNRYPPVSGVDDDWFPYDGDRLRDDVHTFPRRLGALDEGESIYDPRLDDAPLQRVGTGPDLAPLRARARHAKRGYAYFHYPDRVEVAPVVAPLGLLGEDELSGVDTPFLKFHAANLGQAHVVRIEIAGQAVPLPDETVPPAHSGCRRAYYPLGLAAIEDPARIPVRWQTADRPGHWHTSELALPALRGDAPARATHRLPSALLYFTADGGVRAERFTLWNLRDDRLGIQTSGVPSGMPAPPCGGATAQFDMSRVQLLD
ncbi:hypothetical protein LDO26_03120 [Luteimonas sp. BDR2-5]|uniref:hypothetical protein n=1 Tax=Proluteimonas luteida TaxID=2878685 RepID=UPI001E437F86|nr:hypothetical protein [Luteimonas sp. BDR2-5]MCD9027205.1 hypothetical protein [Luteimonas sp. BDR2-5]